MPLTIDLLDLDATRLLALHLAPMLRAGDVVALEGTLGAGKTTFARTLLQGLGVEGEVPSPTFTLVQSYELPRFNLHHFDLYRLKDAAELDELGWDDMLHNGVSVIEWPERAAGRMPRDYLKLSFATDAGERRHCVPTPFGNWQSRWKDAA